MSRARYKRYLAEVDECFAATREGIALQRERLEKTVRLSPGWSTGADH
jgi:hypothetical protein